MTYRRVDRVPCGYCGQDRLEPSALTVRQGKRTVPACAPCYHAKKGGGQRPCYLCFADRTLGHKDEKWARLEGHAIPVCVDCKNSDLLAWLQRDHRLATLRANASANRPKMRVTPGSYLAERFAEIDAAFNQDA